MPPLFTANINVKTEQEIEQTFLSESSFEVCMMGLVDSKSEEYLVSSFALGSDVVK